MSSTLSDSHSGLDRDARKALKTPDGFMTTGTQAFDQASKHTRLLIFGVLAFVAIVGATAFFITKKEAHSNQAMNAYYVALKTEETEMKALTDAEEKAKVGSPDAKADKKPKAEPESMEYAAFDIDTKLPESVKKLRAVSTEFEGTRAAFEARMKLGALYMRHGSPDKAADIFSKASQGAPNIYERAIATSGQAYALENSGKAQEALQAYQHALDMGETSLRGDLMMGLARTYVLLHDNGKAKTTYEQIITQFPNSESAKNAQLLLENL